jgi:hypothetical protein
MYRQEWLNVAEEIGFPNEVDRDIEKSGGILLLPEGVQKKEINLGVFHCYFFFFFFFFFFH